MSGKKGKKTEIERFSFVYQESGLSQTSFGTLSRFSKSQMNHFLSGRTKPSHEVLDALASKYNLNINWFLSGLGRLYGNKGNALVEMVKQETSVGRGVGIEDMISVGDILLIKRTDFCEIQKSIILISVNPSYPSRVIARQKLENVKIEGLIAARLYRI
jgi:transcriptional regulator with XRE-family HTH domain